MCTLETSGQVASRKKRLRAAARSGTRFGTPWAEKTTGCVGVGDLVELLDEDGTLRLQALNDIAVVDDLVAHVDRRTEALQRHLDDLDRPVDARRRSRAGHRAECGVWRGRSCAAVSEGGRAASRRLKAQAPASSRQASSRRAQSGDALTASAGIHSPSIPKRSSKRNLRSCRIVRSNGCARVDPPLENEGDAVLLRGERFHQFAGPQLLAAAAGRPRRPDLQPAAVRGSLHQLSSRRILDLDRIAVALEELRHRLCHELFGPRLDRLGSHPSARASPARTRQERA